MNKNYTKILILIINVFAFFNANSQCGTAINITAYPVTNQAIVCNGLALPGALSATNVPTACGGASNFYKGGQDAIYTFTAPVTGSYTISYTGVSYSAIFVYSGSCPSSGGTCVNSVGSSATTKSLTVSLTLGTVYYIWFDTWPTPNSVCPGTFSISGPPLPPPTLTSFSPSAGCGGSQSVIITGTNFAGISSVSFGGTPALSFIVNSTTQITAIPAAAGATGQITVVGSAGSVTSVPSFTHSPAPIVVATPATSVACAGASVALSATGADTYTWNPGALTGSSVNVTQAATTTYTVTGTTTATGCTATSTATITINPLPTLTPSATPTTVCVGGSTSLMANDSVTGSPIIVTPNAYGSSVAGGATEDEILSVTVGSFTNASTCATGGGGVAGNGLPASILNRYSNYTTTALAAPLLVPGSTVSGSLIHAECAAVSGTQSYAVYIDFNRNGNWDLPAEQVALVTGLAWTGATPTTRNFTINVPVTAQAGATLMRVMQYEGAITGPTFSSFYGETEDYKVEIKGPSTLPNSAFVWTPSANIATNPNRNVTASPVNATTTYTVTATDGNGCTATATKQVIVNPLTAGAATATPLIICANQTSQLQVTPSGGGAPYTYSWLPAGTLSNASIANPVATPTATTVYTVTVSDACGSSYTQTNVVVVNPAPTVTGTATPSNVCSGSTTTLTGSGNASSYSWSGGATNGVPFIPAATGVYTVTGTSINGCTATSTVLVTKIAPFYDTTGNDVAICMGASANIIAGDSIPPVPVGCVPTYSSGTGFGDYIQSISGFLNNVTGAGPSPYYTNYASPTATLTAGTPYVLNVTTGTYTVNDVALWIDYNNNGTFDPVEKIGEFDNLGAASVATFNVTVPLSTNNGTIKLRIVEADQGTTGGMLPCAAYSYGETEDYTITITGGVLVIPPVYTYTWMPGSLSGAAQTVTPAATTIYTVTQTDANGCTATATQMVTVNPNPTTTVTSTTVASCVPGCDGTATMDATGGTSPYAYTVSASATAAGNVVSGICAATTYTVTATDANGCIGTVSTTGVQATNPIVTATPAAVSVCQNAMTTLVGGGATTYSWSGSIIDNTPFSVTASTIYTVTGTDAMGCSATATSDVTMLALPTVTATPAAVSVCQNATTTLVGGGASTYSWSGGITDNTPFAVTASTVYTVTGTDASGCSNTATSDVTMTAAPVITATPNTVNNCVGSSTDLTASGGLTYVWMPGSVSGAMLTVPAYTGSGTYTVTGTDAGGCSATATAVVTNTLPNGDLTQAGVGNTSSITGNQCKSTTHPNDGQPLAYFDNSCQIIASVQEPNGGLNLGPVNTCVTIDPSVQLVNGQPYARRWFEITPTTNGPATVSLYLTLADFLDYNAAPAAAGWPLLPTTASSTDPNIPNIRVTKNDAGILSVITPTVSYDVVNSRFVLTFPVSGFSQFRVHSVNAYNAPLPVTYKSFTARKENTVDVLDWTTGSEENNKQFNVERSANGEDFSKIGVVASKAPNGNSQIDINYTFVDEKPLTGHNYYRLAQEDIDGKINYSKTIDLIWGSNGTISMYPNPTSGLLNVEINIEKASNITLRVMDMSGRTVKTTEAKAVQGVNKVELNLNDVSSGIYNVQVIENGKLIVTNRVNKK